MTPETGNFKYLYIPKNKTVNTLSQIFSTNSDLGHQVMPQINLNKGFAGIQFTVGSFSNVSSNKTGNKTLGVIDVSQYTFIEGPSSTQAVVDFEQAIISGEIIKIKAINYRKIPQFVFNKDSIQPVVVESKRMQELYSKTLRWYYAYYYNKAATPVTTVENKEITIAGVKNGLSMGRLMGVEVTLPVKYRFLIAFKENEIQLTFISVGDGDLMTEPKNTKRKKAYEDLKVKIDAMMNELSASLVAFLDK